VVINGNDVRQNSAGARGGGIFVATDTASDTDSSLVTVTTNIVEENEAGGALSLGGGLYAATGAINGLGEETIVIGIADARNALRNNVSGGWGGGLSVALAPGNGAAHTLTVASNDVTTNTAAFGGGGIHATSVAEDLATGTNALRILGNDLIGNHALGDPADPMTAGGGGIYLDAASHRTPDDVVALEIARNELRGNDATAFGGGATLSVVADDDPFLDGATQPATASLRFENNLIVANVTADGGAGTAFGGGVALFARAVGADATVAVAQRFLSVIDNESDAGAGGLDWSAAAQADSLGGIGTVAIELSNSILMGNDGFAVGGSIVPGGTISATIAYNDAIDNVGGDYAPALGASTGTNGNVAIDPGLDALYVPQLCAPIIDLGDPALDASTEPLPNGGRVNIGHHGNSIDAARTLPDVNADALVDGVDVLAVAVSFNAASPDPRYLAEADLDLNGIVDGDDLAYVSAFFAQSCPEAVP
jgi:hypothetical protein